MPGYNVVLNFPHGEQKVFLDVDMPRAGVVYTGFDGEKWIVTDARLREDVIDDQDTHFEATMEQLGTEEPPAEPAYGTRAPFTRRAHKIRSE